MDNEEKIKELEEKMLNYKRNYKTSMLLVV